MSEIINRTPETWGQSRERQKLESNSVPDLEPPDPIEGLTTQARFDSKLDNRIIDPIEGLSSVQVTPSTITLPPSYSAGLQAIPDPKPNRVFDVDHPVNSGEPNQESGDLRLSVTLLGLEHHEFRAKVISAFKHLGLDIKKHFEV